jgi:hypothetical protein
MEPRCGNDKTVIFFRQNACLLRFSSTFRECGVAIGRQIGEPLSQRTWTWPLHFDPLDLRSPPDSQDHAGVVRGEVAASGGFKASGAKVARLVSYAYADGVRIGFLANQLP